MAEQQRQLAIGLMSGTSMDGIDAAVIETDGDTVFAMGASVTAPYSDEFRARLRAVVGVDPKGNEEAAIVAEDLTRQHVAAVEQVLSKAGLSAADIGLIGFHGHTVLHRPEHGVTCQIGDGALLARETGVAVITDFRSADVAAGGEGAPLAPVYHVALTRTLERPVALLNVGGVANVTWVSPDGGAAAFDTGPGNALIDDWVRAGTGAAMDEGGRLARAGQVDGAVLAQLLAHPYFTRPYPKSLDRDAFSLTPLEHLSAADGAATLVEFTAGAVEAAQDMLPAPPLRWLVTGGGRHNAAIMAALRRRLGAPVEPVEAEGWRGDALEAQAFAYLAVRSEYGLPLSYPQTTGVERPVSGGVRYDP
jgi:anhydro-N-acetylmuramic acid kinase